MIYDFCTAIPLRVVIVVWNTIYVFVVMFCSVHCGIN